MGSEQQADVEEASRAAWTKNNDEFQQTEEETDENNAPLVDFSDEDEKEDE